MASANVGAGGAVAIFHYTIGQRVSRGGGQSSLRSAAYLSRECYRDERTGWTHDFAAKSPTMEASDHIARVGRHAEGPPVYQRCSR